MNKKFLFGAALVGILGFGSCVDNNESPSVTNIREAKAEQLKALAAVENANAQAALIAANAEAKAKEAQAAYYEAQAAYQQAMADYQAAQTEEAKARAEEAIARAEVEKQRAANELQTLAGQLEIDLLKQKTDLLVAQSEYEKAIQGNNDEAKAKLTALLDAYKIAQDALFDAQKDLAKDQIELAKLKAGLSTGEEYLQFQIDQANKQITKLTKENLDKQAYIDTWKSYTKGEAQEAIDKAYQEKLALEKDEQVAIQKQLESENAKTLAKNALDNSDYMKAVYEVLAYDDYDQTYPYPWNSNHISVRFVSEDNSQAPKEARGKYCAYIPKYANYQLIEETFIPLFSGEEKKREYIEYSLVNYDKGYPADGAVTVEKEGYDVYSSYYNLVPGSVEQFIVAVKENKQENETNLANSTKNYEECVETQAEAQVAYDKSVAAYEALEKANETLTNANKAVDAAQDVVDKAGDKATDAQKKALKDAQDAAQVAQTAQQKASDAYSEAGTVYDNETALNNAKAATTRQLQDKNSCEYNVNQDQKLVAMLTANAEVLNTGVAGNSANMKALNEADLALANAKKDTELAKSAYGQKNAEYNALSQIVSSDSNGNDIESKITQYEREIGYNEQTIALNKDNIANWEDQIKENKVNMEKTILEAENTVEKDKANVEILQKKYDLAKADLDAAMEEETPAE